jgi:WD40 repeat protein
MIVSLAVDNELRFWDAETGSLLNSVSIENLISYSAHCMWFNEDGSKFLMADDDKVYIFNKSGRLCSTFVNRDAHYANITHAAFAPDGTVVTLSDDAVCRWNEATGELVSRLPFRNKSFSDACLSPDGAFSAAQVDGRSIKVIETTANKTIAILHRDISAAKASFSPDGKNLAISYSGEGERATKACVWNLETGKCEPSFPDSLLVTIAEDANKSYSAERMLKAINVDGAVRLVSMVDGREVATFYAYQDGEWVMLTPDGYYDASPAGGGHLTVVDGDHAVGIDKWEAEYHRPDIIASLLRCEWK